MILDNDAIGKTSNTLLLPKGKKLHEKTTLNVPRVVFSCTPGGSGQLNASGEGYFRTDGGRGQSPRVGSQRR